MRRLEISIGRIRLQIVVNASPTADAVWKAAPFEALTNTWGNEVYFRTPVQAELETSGKCIIELGEVAYWPPGQAIAIGFGPTPISHGQEIRLASAANVFGTCNDDLRALKTVSDGMVVRVARLENEKGSR
jgi:hypothetical protein